MHTAGPCNLFMNLFTTLCIPAGLWHSMSGQNPAASPYKNLPVTTLFFPPENSSMDNARNRDHSQWHWPCTAKKILLGVLLTSLCCGSVSGEGAGSALADVGLCRTSLQLLMRSPFGTVAGVEVPAVEYNGSVYSLGGVRFVVPEGPEVPVPVVVGDLIQNLTNVTSLDNETTYSLAELIVSDVMDEEELAEILEELLGYGVLAGVEDMSKSPKDDASESPPRNTSFPWFPSERTLSIGSIQPTSEYILADADETFAGNLSSHRVVSVTTETIQNLAGNSIQDVLVTLQPGSIQWSNQTLEGALSSDMPDEVEDASSLVEDLVERLLPESCLSYTVVTPETDDIKNDTIVTTVTDEAGNEVEVTCVTRVHTLEHTVLRVHVIGDETEAYIKEDGTLGGYIGQSFAELRSQITNLTFAYRNLTLDSLSKYPSPWTACIYEINKGRLDLCLGEFFDTEDRRLLTEISALVELKSVVLVGLRSTRSIDYGRLFRPFTPELWAAIILVVVMFAILFWAFSYRKETNDFAPEFSEWKRFGHSVHLSIQSLLGAALTTDLSEPLNSVYWLSAAYAFFIVVVIAAYTANLAAILTAVAQEATFADISDVIAGGHRVCVQTSLQQSVNALISRDLKVMETVSVQESLRNIDDGKCVGAIIQLDAMHFQPEEQCNTKVVIGDMLFSIPTGIPVRQRYEGLISQMVTRLRSQGVIGAYYNQMLEELNLQTCATLGGGGEDDGNVSLGILQAVPLFVLVGVLFAVASVVHGIDWAMARRRAKREQRKRENSLSEASMSGCDSGEHVAIKFHRTLQETAGNPHDFQVEVLRQLNLLKETAIESNQRLQHVEDVCRATTGNGAVSRNVSNRKAPKSKANVDSIDEDQLCATPVEHQLCNSGIENQSSGSLDSPVISAKQPE